MSDNCPIIMKENKDEKKEDTKPHFVCEIAYAPHQDWRTDFTLGQKGLTPHGHMALSGAAIWYLRDEQGNEIVKDGQIVTNISQSQSDYKQDTSEESQHLEQSPSENEDNSNSSS